MKSVSLLNAEKQTLTAKLKTLQKSLKEVGSSLQPQITSEIAEVEKQIVEVEHKIKLVKKEEKQKQVEEKVEQKEEEQDDFQYNEFVKALKIYDETQMCFYRNNTPTYFYKKTFHDLDAKTGLPRPPTTELLFFGASSLRENWLDLQSETSQRYFKKMVHGGEISVKDPQTGKMQVHSFQSRVYTKLGNTRHTPDKETYNMINLENIMRPTGIEDECPPIIKQLLLAITGNVIDENGNLSKPENLEWFEKWLYGVLVADIGNNMLSMPVIFGSGKVGKNALFDKIFVRVFGTELCFTGLWESLDGNFNGFKLGKVFIYLDEIPARDEWSRLKSLTGSVTELIKKKYGPEFVVENTVAMAIGSNSVSFPLPLEDGKQMTRISPMCTDQRSTFAENTYRYFESISPGSLEQILKSQGVNTQAFSNDPYELGDKFLRMNEDLWCSKEEVQKFLNYLHGKFKDEKYSLAPLRGKDWDEIVRSRPNPMHEVISYIKERNIQMITVQELHEIYKVIMNDRKVYVKEIKNFSNEVWALLKNEGYERKQQARVFVQLTGAALAKAKKDGKANTERTQTTVFHKPGQYNAMHIQSVNDYIFEEQIGGNTVRMLKYP